jgi:hypothetical protein
MTRARETSENARQAKAWVNFDGTFATSPFTEANGGIRDSFNVDSVTDINTGRYTVNFTNNFSNTDYAVSITVGGAQNAMWFRTYEDSVARTTSAFHFLTAQFSNGAFMDMPQINVIFFGE